jgi:hypothetical protein
LPNILHAIRCRWIRCTSRNRKALRDLPAELHEYWASTAQRAFEGIPRDALFYLRAADALLTYFECVKRSKGKCALPSKAADSVWQAWLGYSRASLDAFCMRHYGKRIPHTPAGVGGGSMTKPLAVTLVAARALDYQKLAGPDVPRLFATDRVLRMPFGFAYDMTENWLVYRHMNRHGEAEGEEHIHPGTSPDFLYAARLIPKDEFERWQNRSRGIGSDWTGSTSSSGSDDTGTSSGDDTDWGDSAGESSSNSDSDSSSGDSDRND